MRSSNASSSSARPVGRDDGEPGQLQAPDGQRLPCHEFVERGLLRRRFIPERSQQARLHVGEQGPALLLRGVAGKRHVFDALAKREPALRPALKPLERCTVTIVARMGLLVLFPVIEAGLDVALEHLGKVVVAVKFVLVFNAREGLNGFKDRHVRLPRVWRRQSGRGGRRRASPGSKVSAQLKACPRPIFGRCRRRR